MHSLCPIEPIYAIFALLSTICTIFPVLALARLTSMPTYAQYAWTLITFPIWIYLLCLIEYIYALFLSTGTWLYVNFFGKYTNMRFTWYFINVL